MIPWLRGLWSDEAKFIAGLRSLLALAGTLLVLLPVETLAGYGKWGALLVPVALLLRAGDRNPK